MARAAAPAMASMPRRTSPRSSPPGGRRGCPLRPMCGRQPTVVRFCLAPPLDGRDRHRPQCEQRLRRRRPRRPARRAWRDDAGHLRRARDAMRSKRRRGTPGDLGYQVFVVADACRAVDTADLRGGSGRLRMCGRCRSRISKARLRPSSTSRRRSEPPRRPRRASDAGREEPNGADQSRSWPSAERLAPSFRAPAGKVYADRTISGA